MTPDPEANPWQTLSTETKYENPWIRIDEHQVLRPDGQPGIYGVVHMQRHATGVVPIDDKGYTWLVGQYRYPLKRYSWEIPEGGGPHDQDPQETARRELLEETGLTATRWNDLGTIHLSNCVTDEVCYLYLARDLSEGSACPDPEEQLQVRRLPLTDAMAMVDDRTITDAVSILALTRATAMLATSPGEAP